MKNLEYKDFYFNNHEFHFSKINLVFSNETMSL